MPFAPSPGIPGAPPFDPVANKANLITEARAAVPVAVVRLRTNRCPQFRNKVYSGKELTYRGTPGLAWLFDGIVTYENDARMLGGRRESGSIKFGLWTNLQVTSGELIVTDGVRLSEPLVLDRLEPVRVKAVLDMLKGLQGDPGLPKHYVPYLPPIED